VEGLAEATLLKTEIERLETRYAILRHYLSGADYNIKEVRECLQDIKDGLSRVRALLIYIIYSKTQKPLDIFLIEPLLSSIDAALILTEIYPQNARIMIQASLALSRLRIEDVMAFLALLKTMLQSPQSSQH